MNRLGADPGKSGGIALVAGDGTLIDAMPMPQTRRDLLDVLEEYKQAGPLRATVERVSAFRGQSAGASFTFGQHYERICLALMACGIPFEEVGPNVWQKGYRLPTLAKAGSKTKKKNRHKARAQELFPGVKVTHATADALLIAEFARRSS